MNESDVKQITDSIAELVKESVYEQTKHKDKEVSGLHRQILTKIEDLTESMADVKKTVDSHDILINEWLDIYRTGSWIVKFGLWFIIFVPGVAGFVAALIYFKNLIFPS